MLAQFDIILLIILPVLHILVNHTLRDVAVEDEALHVKQARAYYHWDFMYWHHMITTPPGLYIVSMLSCSSRLYMLRPINLLFGSLIPVVADNTSILVVLMPIMFPFIFLYYTDCGSLFLVLLAEHLYHKEYFYSSALVKFNRTSMFSLICVGWFCVANVQTDKHSLDWQTSGYLIHRILEL